VLSLAQFVACVYSLVVLTNGALCSRVVWNIGTAFTTVQQFQL